MKYSVIVMKEIMRMDRRYDSTFPYTSRFVLLPAVILAHMRMSEAFMCHVPPSARPFPSIAVLPAVQCIFSQVSNPGYGSYAHRWHQESWTSSGSLRASRSHLTMFSNKRLDERALGDRLVREEQPGSEPGIGISVEPPGFFKRLFSVPRNVRRKVAVNDVVVPVIGARDGWGGIRQGLVDRGIYPGVEYRILDISIVPWAVGEAPSALKTAREAPDGTFETGELVLTMRPVYPLVSRLERPWPVRVPARELPVLLEPFYYNAATAWAALTTSLSFLTLGFVLSQALTLSVIPSRSMEPTLQVGDVILVEKVSHASLVHRNDIMFFNPPPALRQVVAEAGGTLNNRDLFVKRIAALPGDTVTVGDDGRVKVKVAERSERPATRATMTEGNDGRRGEGQEGELAPLPESVLRRIQVTENQQISPDEVFVLGDNPAASMDSRVWGTLDEKNIVGHALVRIFPLKNFGPLR